MAIGCEPVQPLLQGDLDGLCGIYAIINAMTKLYPAEIDDEAQRWLFNQLIDYAFHEQGNLQILTHGIGQRDMRGLAKEAAELIVEYFELNVFLRQPWRFQTSRPPSAQRLKKLANNPYCSILIGLERPSRHWSVIKGFGRGRFRLLDSDIHEDLPIDKVKITSNLKRVRSDQYVIIPSAIFILETKQN